MEMFCSLQFVEVLGAERCGWKEKQNEGLSRNRRRRFGSKLIEAYAHPRAAHLFWLKLQSKKKNDVVLSLGA